LLYQTAKPKILLDDNIINGSHDESDLCCICCACEMSVDLFLLGLVERYKSVEDIVASGSIVRATLVVWEVILHWADRQLFLEAINLVQEEDN